MIEFASIFSVATNIGYPLIFAIVVIETGCGVPVAPGEIAVLTGGIAAAAGKLNIEAVIAVGAVAAIIGDNIGYVVGKKGGRWLLERPGLFYRQRSKVLGMADWFFDRHGPRRCSSDAGCRCCACTRHGWRGALKCRGARSRSGTPPAALRGR